MWTQAQYDALTAALSSGLKRVKYNAGNEVEYQTTAEMLALKQKMEAALGLDASGQPRGANVFDHSIGVVEIRY